mmetsp:Transcript_12387/g.1120  ORF Transcript_12387/g.1120 Transcript_12387/m.1120 type:complete len:103 (-) Transcript_12387:208-516(-)
MKLILMNLKKNALKVVEDSLEYQLLINIEKHVKRYFNKKEKNLTPKHIESPRINLNMKHIMGEEEIHMELKKRSMIQEQQLKKVKNLLIINGNKKVNNLEMP